MFFLRLVIVQMRLKEKVGLVLLAVIFYKTACSLCVTHPAEENPFEKYMTKIKRGKIQSIPKHGIYDKENGRKSIDVLSDSTLLNDMRKEKRRKRKNKPNEKVYSRDDLLLTSLPESFRNQEPIFYFNEMGSFPEVQYPLTASETWAPSYWNQLSFNKEEAYYHRDDLKNQNKKQKKKNIEAFLQPSIMKTILKAQEKKSKINSVENHTIIGEVNKILNETIIIDDISDSSSITKKPQGHQKTSKQPLAREKSLKKVVAKAQHATSASKKLLTESIASHSRSKLFPKMSKSNNKEFITHESDTNNATIIVLPTDNFVAKDQIEILDEDLSANKESASNSKLIDATNFDVSKENYTDALINTIKTYDQNSSHVMTDNDSNQLELLLAITASEPSMESNATPAYATDEKVLQTSSISNSITVLFNDSVRQSIFDVLSTEKLNASSLRENILKILLSEEQSPTLAANKEGLLIKNLTDVDIVYFPLTDTMIDIIGPPITEEAPETTKEVSSHSSWTETHNYGIETTQQPIETMLEIPLTESTRSGELETTSTDESIPEISIISSVKKETQTPSSNENISDLILTNDLAGNLREIISKPSDSHSLVHDLREIIHLLTIWNSHIDDADKKNNNSGDVPIDDWTTTVPIASSITLTKETTANNTPTDERPEEIFVKSEIQKDNQIDKVTKTTFGDTPKDDQTDKVPVLTSNDTYIVSGVTSDTLTNDWSVNINSLNTSSNTSNDHIVFEGSTNENLIDDLTDTVSATVTLDTSTNAGIDQVPKVIISNIPSEDNSTLVFVDTPRSTIRNDQPDLASIVSASDIPVQDKYNKTPVSTNNISTDDRSGIFPVTTSSDIPIDDQTNIVTLAKSDTPSDDRSIYRIDTTDTKIPNHIYKTPESKLSDTRSDNLSDIIPVAAANDTRKGDKPDVDNFITPSDTPTDGQADTVINDNKTDDQSGIVPAVTANETLDQNDIIIVSTTDDFLNDERSDTVSNTLSNISTDLQNTIVPVSITNENLIGDWSSLNTSSDLPTNEQIFIAPAAIKSVPPTDELYEIIPETAPNDTPSDNQIYIAHMAIAMDNRTHDWSDVVPIDTPNDTLEADQFELAPVITSRDDRINIVPVATIRDPQTINESIVDSKEIIMALTDYYRLTDKSSLNTSSDLPTNEQIFIAPVALVSDPPIDKRYEIIPESVPNDTPLDDKIYVVPMPTAMDNQTHDWSDVVPKDTPNDSPEADQIKISPVFTSRDKRINIVPEATLIDRHIFNESTADSEEIVIDLTDSYGSIDKSAVDQTEGHALKPGTNPSKTIINSTRYKNDDTWASELSTFPDPGTVSSLAQEEEYSKSLMSFISNYMAMTNTLTDNPTKTPSKTISDPDFMTYNSSIDSLNNDNITKTDPLNENLAQDVFFNKNINKVSPTDFDDINSASEILPEPGSDYVTDSVKCYLISPFDLDETIINDLSDIITNQHFNETITDTDSPSKFTFNDILSDENDSFYPISFVSTYMTNDNETFLLTQNDTNTYTLLKDDLYDTNILESDEPLIQNMCPIIEDTSLENQCYIYENSDVFNSTSNHTDILSGKLLSNAKAIDLAEDSLNKDTPISQEMLDFTDYYTLSPDDTTTDFYDSALFSEFMDSKYQDSKKLTSDLVYDVFDTITKFREEDTSQHATNELLDEPAITEDSGKDVSSKKEMDKRSSINQDDLPQGNDKSEASKIMKDEILNDVSSELKTPNVPDELSNKDSSHNIQESSQEDEILYDSEDIPNKQNEHDLADIAINTFEENNNKSDRLYNIFPKLEFLM